MDDPASGIKKMNVLLYEPAPIEPGMRIGLEVLRKLKHKVNEPFAPVLARLAERELVPRGDIEDILQTGAHRKHPYIVQAFEQVAGGCRFFVNTDVYYEAGAIPGDMKAFQKQYEVLAPEGIQAALLNTAGAAEHYVTLAGRILVGEFPLLSKCVWVVADCPYAPMPRVFRELVDERKSRRKGHTTVTNFSVSGGSYTIPITDKPGKPEAAAGEAADAMYRRLKYLRELAFIK